MKCGCFLIFISLFVCVNAQDFLHTKRAELRATFFYHGDLITAINNDTEIIINKRNNEIWIGIHVRSLKTGIKEIDNSLFKDSKSIIINGRIPLKKDIENHLKLEDFWSTAFVLPEKNGKILAYSVKFIPTKNKARFNLFITFGLSGNWLDPNLETFIGKPTVVNIQIKSSNIRAKRNFKKL